MFVFLFFWAHFEFLKFLSHRCCKFIIIFITRNFISSVAIINGVSPASTASDWSPFVYMKAVDLNLRALILAGLQSSTKQVKRLGSGPVLPWLRRPCVHDISTPHPRFLYSKTRGWVNVHHISECSSNQNKIAISVFTSLPSIWLKKLDTLSLLQCTEPGCGYTAPYIPWPCQTNLYINGKCLLPVCKKRKERGD